MSDKTLDKTLFAVSLFNAFLSLYLTINAIYESDFVWVLYGSMISMANIYLANHWLKVIRKAK